MAIKSKEKPHPTIPGYAAQCGSEGSVMIQRSANNPHELWIIQRQWMARAPKLARWAWSLLVNRTDVWGGYHGLADRDKIIVRRDGTKGPLGKTTTRPAVAKRGQVLLTVPILEQHFRATEPQLVVGLHTTGPDNTSKWGAVEVDWHDATSTPSTVNLAAVLAWYDLLRDLGFSPLLTDSNGNGGFHLLVIFATPVPTASVFSFLKWFTRNHAEVGLAKPPETFPKQTRVAPGRYGNWLRLPGRHHTREHLSRVWDGTMWLVGTAAVTFILSLQGNCPSFIPSESVAFSASPAPASTCQIRAEPANQGGLAACIRAYLNKLPTSLGEGQHRDDYAFNFACFLVRDLARSDEIALAWLAEWDALQAAPKGKDRLREILANAHRYGQRAYGCGLRPSQPPRREHGHVILTSRVEID